MNNPPGGDDTAAFAVPDSPMHSHGAIEMQNDELIVHRVEPVLERKLLLDGTAPPRM